MQPFVISGDLSSLLGISPTALEGFREALTQALHKSVGTCEWVPEAELFDGMVSMTKTCPVPLVSLDPIYVPSPFALNITRLIDVDGNEVGYGLRNGQPLHLVDEIRRIVSLINGNEIALVDDVLFSGAMMTQIASCFREQGVKVRRVYAGVAIGDGVRRLRLDGIEVKAVRTYDEVMDEICERDFFPGAPMSGRTVFGLPNTGAPYLSPFGNAEKWASIPADQVSSFSCSVLNAVADVYEVIPTRITDLPRQIHELVAGKEAWMSSTLRSIAQQI